MQVGSGCDMSPPGAILLWAGDCWVGCDLCQPAQLWYAMHVCVAGMQPQRQPTKAVYGWLFGKECSLLSTEASWTASCSSAEDSLGLVLEQVVALRGSRCHAGWRLPLPAGVAAIGHTCLWPCRCLNDLLSMVVYYGSMRLWSTAWQDLDLGCWGLSGESPA